MIWETQWKHLVTGPSHVSVPTRPLRPLWKDAAEGWVPVFTVHTVRVSNPTNEVHCGVVRSSADQEDSALASNRPATKLQSSTDPLHPPLTWADSLHSRVCPSTDPTPRVSISCISCLSLVFFFSPFFLFLLLKRSIHPPGGAFICSRRDTALLYVLWLKRLFPVLLVLSLIITRKDNIVTDRNRVSSYLLETSLLFFLSKYQTDFWSLSAGWKYTYKNVTLRRVCC